MKKLSALRNKKGFTLVELVVVMVIIAILAAALVTSLYGYIQKAKETNGLIEAHNVYIAVQAYVAEQVGIGGTSSNVKINDGKVSFTNESKMLAVVNEYLGMPSDKQIAQSRITDIKADTKGSINGMKYTATNNVPFVMADGVWQKDPTPTT